MTLEPSRFLVVGQGDFRDFVIKNPVFAHSLIEKLIGRARMCFSHSFRPYSSTAFALWQAYAGPVFHAMGADHEPQRAHSVPHHDEGGELGAPDIEIGTVVTALDR